MEILHFCRVTREFQGAGAADPDPLTDGAWLIPAHAIAAAAAPLPPCRDGYARVLSATGESWEYVEDHRGAEGWLPDGTSHVMATLGPLPEGWTKTTPLPSLEIIHAAKQGEIRSGYEAALSGVIAGPGATATGVAIESAMMAAIDPEGLEYLVDRLTIRREELEQALADARSVTDPVTAILGIVVSYPT